MVIITPLLALQALQIGSKVAAEVVEDPKVKDRLRTFNQIAAIGTSMAGAFKSPSTGLKIADGKLGDLGESTGMINPKGFGAFKGALPKGGNFDLPKDMMGGGFGLKMPKGWNTPKNKGIFDFTPQDTLQDQWNPGLAIYG